MIKNVIQKVIILVMLFSCFSFAFPVYAEPATLKDAFKTDADGNEDPLDSAASTAGYDTDDANTKFNTIISTIIKTILSMLGIIFLVLMMYGGFLWMTARGNESQVEKAKNLITSAMIGLGIVVGAYVITVFIISKISVGVLT